MYDLVYTADMFSVLNPQILLTLVSLYYFFSLYVLLSSVGLKDLVQIIHWQGKPPVWYITRIHAQKQ